mmetsp:Transcript_21109/g.81934  ORF Transcript_21109/g.81934 Transcript_21109/m.81934 type:complete len:515 (-) Transcript_21109:2778-4322(-)
MARGHAGLQADRRHRRRRLAGRRMDLKAEAAALPRPGAVSRQASSQQLGQRAADGQAEAGAAVLPRGAGLGLLVALEQPPQRLGRQSDARVAHLKDEPVCAAPPHDQPHLALRRELDGIGQQVQQHLAQPGRVGEHRLRQLGRRVQHQRHALLGGPEPHDVHAAIEQRTQPHRQSLDAHLAGLDLGEVQDVVDHRHQRLGRVANGLGLFALVGVQRRVQQQPAHADHAIHGGADLVAHRGEEGAFGLVGGVGGGAGCRRRLRLGTSLGLLHGKLARTLHLAPGAQHNVADEDRRQAHLGEHLQPTLGLKRTRIERPDYGGQVARQPGPPSDQVNDHPAGCEPTDAVALPHHLPADDQDKALGHQHERAVHMVGHAPVDQPKRRVRQVQHGQCDQQPRKVRRTSASAQQFDHCDQRQGIAEGVVERLQNAQRREGVEPQDWQAEGHRHPRRAEAEIDRVDVLTTIPRLEAQAQCDQAQQAANGDEHDGRLHRAKRLCGQIVGRPRYKFQVHGGVA